MKISFLKISGFALLVLLAIKVMGINSFYTDKESEISFHQGSWSEALDLAKNEN